MAQVSEIRDAHPLHGLIIIYAFRRANSVGWTFMRKDTCFVNYQLWFTLINGCAVIQLSFTVIRFPRESSICINKTIINFIIDNI